MLTIKLLVQRDGTRRWRLAQCGLHDLQYLFRLGWLWDGEQNSARLCKRKRFLYMIGCRCENDLGGSDPWVGSQMTNEFVSIHGGHQDVRNHQVGAFHADTCKRLGAIGGFQQAVSLISEQRSEILTAGSMIVNDQNCCGFLARRYSSFGLSFRLC